MEEWQSLEVIFKRWFSTHREHLCSRHVSHFEIVPDPLCPIFAISPVNCLNSRFYSKNWKRERRRYQSLGSRQADRKWASGQSTPISQLTTSIAIHREESSRIFAMKIELNAWIDGNIWKFVPTIVTKPEVWLTRFSSGHVRGKYFQYIFFFSKLIE